MMSYRLIKAATLGPELIKAITTTLLGVKPYFHIAQFYLWRSTTSQVGALNPCHHIATFNSKPFGGPPTKPWS